MHFDLGGLWIFLWIFGWGAWSYFEDREHTKKRLAVYDLIHKERIYAMDKGLPYPEMPPYQIDEPEEKQSNRGSSWRLMAGWGICLTITGVGFAAALAAVGEARAYWPLGTIPLWIGLGLLGCAWLYRKTAAR